MKLIGTSNISGNLAACLVKIYLKSSLNTSKFKKSQFPTSESMDFAGLYSGHSARVTSGTVSKAI